MNSKFSGVALLVSLVIVFVSVYLSARSAPAQVVTPPVTRLEKAVTTGVIDVDDTVQVSFFEDTYGNRCYIARPPHTKSSVSISCVKIRPAVPTNLRMKVVPEIK